MGVSYPIELIFSRSDKAGWHIYCVGRSSGRYRERAQAENFVRDWFAHWAENPLPINEINDSNPQGIVPVRCSDIASNLVPPEVEPAKREVEGIEVHLERDYKRMWSARFRNRDSSYRSYPDLESAKLAIRNWVSHWSANDIPVDSVYDESPGSAVITTCTRR